MCTVCFVVSSSAPLCLFVDPQQQWVGGPQRGPQVSERLQCNVCGKRMKRDMKGKRFAEVAEVKEKTTEALSSISKDEFRQCFEKWNKRLDKCISVSGEYFEGD
ncbi:hypothetical protein B7P43_G08535 [Cryptotermes secundus]|uniref:Uncharacterized protein n=1 Tax=Cryptotermes secundus TaxID=105785 RepID=A0A2J7QEW4_9NEOP|nr:hypothetical protein B7P43_G08535 [Cryptotermes secundus]